MMKITDKPPIKFGKIIRESVEDALLEYGFVFDNEYEIPVYNGDGVRLSPEEIEQMLGTSPEAEADSPPPVNEDESHVLYSREREGVEQFIGFIRKYHSDKYDKDCDDEAEKEPHRADENDKHRYSRHFFEVTLVINHGGRNLLTTGEAGIGRNGEDYWYYEDEKDLRTLLREKIIPLLTTVGMKDFDEQSEDESEYSAGSNQGNQKPISNVV
jgi:hypothetical protein